MRKYITLMTYVLLTIGSTGLSQNDSTSSIFMKESVTISTTGDYDYRTKGAPKIPIASPNATSLGVYGAIPIGHYTGLPDISIPIYEINLDGKMIPVKLSYHAAGIKVSQEASSVGLGWTLNAGGCIVREIRGRDDFSTSTPPRGYYYDTTFAHWNSNNDLDINYFNEDLPQYEAYLDGYDSEPDLFYYNFASYSGTIVFDKMNTPGNSGTKAKGIMLKQDEYLNITMELPHNLNMIINDGDGFQYFFSPKESSITYTAHTSGYNPDISKNQFTRNFFDNEETAWYLDSIVAPNKKKISFSYAYETIVTPISVSEDVSYLLDGGSPNTQAAYMYYTYSYSESVQVRLTRISFESGYISFNYTDRLDLESLYAEKAKKLATTTIYNNKNEVIKSAAFQHSYSGNTNSPLKCRLMLDAVIINNHTDKPSSYEFSYNGGELPAKNSPSCDYWGFFNNETPPMGDNSFKLSPEAYYFNGGSAVRHFPGLNKQMNADYIKYGVLTEIKYPTGGKTVFDFEPHDFRNSITDVTYKRTTLAGFYSLRLQAPSYCYVTQKFDITGNTVADMEVRFHPREPDPGYPYPSIYVYIYKKNPSGQYINFKTYLFETNESSYFNNTGSNIYKDNFQLPAGTYYFDIRNNHQGYKESTVSVELTGIARQEVNNGGGGGGGLRVKSITDYIDSNKSTKRVFNYKTGGETTSGILTTSPQHLSQYAIMETKITILPTAVFADTYQSLYLNGYSTPYTPFSRSTQGGLVGYSYVEEKIVDSENENNILGTTSYMFINKQDDSSNLSDRLIKGFPAISHKDNGTPLEICHFDKDMKLKRKKTFEYSPKQNMHNIKGLRVFRLPMVDNGDATIKYYDLPADRWQLIRTKEYDYTENSMEPVTTITEYGYNNTNFLANYVKTNDSRNNVSEKQIKYPVDFSSSINIEMKNKHMVNLPVEVIESVTVGNINAETSRTRSEYFRDAVKTKNLVLLGKIETSHSGISGLRTDITFERYDQKGNIVQTVTVDGLNTVYLWGHNQQYPIAEINNASYSQVSGFINETLLNSISTKVEPSASDMTLINGLRTKLPESLITTYTYKPLVGMTSKTDPHGITIYYEYDSFGRLKQAKDANGKVLEQYDYHYKP